MHDSAPEGWARLAPPLYLSGIVLIAMPLVDFATNVTPLAWGNVQWRYGAIGLLSGFMHTPLLGLLLVIAAAKIRNDYVVQRVVGIVCVASAGVILLMSGLFVLDVLQVRRDVTPEGKGMFELGAVKATFKHLLSVGVFGWFGMALLRGLPKKKRQRSEPAASLVRPA